MYSTSAMNDRRTLGFAGESQRLINILHWKKHSYSDTGCYPGNKKC